MNTSQKHNLTELLESYDGDVERLKKDLDTLKSIIHKQPKKADRTYGEVLVEVKQASKVYDQGKSKVHALKKVDLTIREGEFISLIGPSGSGKSTLLNAIAGLDRLTEGEVTVNGVSLRQLSEPRLAEYRNKTLGFVFQFFYLQPFLTVQRNVEVPLMFAGAPSALRGERSSAALEEVGLLDRAQFLPRQISGGQMQRAAIARALVNRPKIILADEPTGNLDSKNSQIIMDLFEDVRNKLNTAIIMVTHDDAVARRADRIVRLNDGELA